MQYPNDSNNNKKTTVNELNLEIPQLNFKKDYKEANRCNEIDFSLGSPDIHQSQRYRASPYHDMLPMFTGDGDSIAKSPEKFGDGSEMNFRPISPENPFTKSRLDHNFNRFFQQKNMDMSDHSVSNIFGPQSPRHERLPINFQYDSTVMNLFEKNTNAPYSVAWLDSLKGGRNFGRGILYLGHHATTSDLKGQKSLGKMDFRSRSLLSKLLLSKTESSYVRK